MASASVSASKLWPRPRPWPQTFGLGLASVYSRRTSSHEEIDGPICLYFTLPTTGHHTMIEDSYCVRERMRNKLCRFDHNDINSPVCCQPSFDTFYSLLYLWPRPWPRPQEIGLGLGLDLKAMASVSASGPGLGLRTLASASVSASRFWPRLTSLLLTRHLMTSYDTIYHIIYYIIFNLLYFILILMPRRKMPACDGSKFCVTYVDTDSY